MLKVDHLFHYPHSFELESGSALPGFQLKYTTLGQLNHERTNVVWVCHALTGSSDISDWWPELFSEDSPLNPRDYFIICANCLGGCYGSTGPLSINPSKRSAILSQLSIAYQSGCNKSFDLLRQELKIEKVHTLIGGSLGGQQVLEWAIEKPGAFEHIVPIACNAFHSPWGIAFNEAQRMAIEADATWKENDDRAGREGMKAARAMGMISFRTYDTFAQTQLEKIQISWMTLELRLISDIREKKLANRFNAFSYWTLTKMMDNHNVGRGRGSAKEAMHRIQAKALVVGIDSDIFFPIEEQRFIADSLSYSRLRVMHSLYGHDGFLVEFDLFKKALTNFINRKK